VALITTTTLSCNVVVSRALNNGEEIARFSETGAEVRRKEPEENAEKTDPRARPR